jgi:DNA-binding IclR family transcriptional regulator
MLDNSFKMNTPTAKAIGKARQVRRRRSATQSGAGIQVIDRAARILRTLEHHPDGLSLGQIAKSVNLARSTVQRIVASLASADFIVVSGPGDVRIGPGLIRIAASITSHTTDMIRPHMQAFAKQIGETIDLSILSNGSTVFLDQIPGQHRLAPYPA